MADNSTSSTPRVISAWVMVAVFAVSTLILLPIALDAGNTEVTVGFGWFVLLMVIFGILLALDWVPSSRDDSCIADNDCHCERRISGARKVRQPVNTWSDLGFVTAGLVILYLIGADRLSGTPAPNPMRESGFPSILYGLLVIYLGPGSMFYHASTKKWGGWLDNMSMVLWTAFLVVYVFWRSVPGHDPLAIIVYLTVVISSGVIIWFVEGSGKYIFGALVAVWGVTEIVILIGQLAGHNVMHLNREQWVWLVLAAISFGLAVLIWLRSKDGKPWCFPDSWAQGHAAWHFLSALSAFFIFLYLRSEILV